MKIALRGLFFHLLCIILFTTLYSSYRDHFAQKNKDSMQFIDFLGLATTLEASVGYSDLYPTTDFGKSLIILQQFVIISTHVLIIYFLTL